MQSVFGSFRDCVVDAVASASGAFGCAHLEQVFTSLEQRSARYHDADGCARIASEQPNCARRVRREVFSSDAICIEEIDGVLCFGVSPEYAAEVYQQPVSDEVRERVVRIASPRALNSTILRELDTVMQRTFASFRDCVVDAVASASGAYGSAPLEQVLASLGQRSTKYYASDGCARSAIEREQHARHVRRVLFASDAIRTLRLGGVTCFAVDDNYATEVFLQPPPETIPDEAPQAKTEDSVCDVGSIRTLESRVLSEVARAPLPKSAPIKHANEEDEKKDLFADIVNDGNDDDDLFRES